MSVSLNEAIKVINDKRAANLEKIRKLEQENDEIAETIRPSTYGLKITLPTSKVLGRPYDYYKNLGDGFIADATRNGCLWSNSDIDVLRSYVMSGKKDLKVISKRLGRTPFACFAKLIPNTLLAEGSVYELWASVFETP